MSKWNTKLYNGLISIERKLARLTKHELPLKEGKVSYLEGGKGPTILFIHGFGANKDNWNAMAKYLTRQFHVVALDLPGFGDSFKQTSHSYGITDQVSRLEEFIAAKKLKDITIIGNSFGGYIGANYAANNELSVKKLVLLSPLGVNTAKQSQMFESILAGNTPLILPKGDQKYKELINALFHHKPFIPGFLVKELAKQAANDNELHTQIYAQTHFIKDNRIAVEQPIETSLANFSKPVTVFWGSSDNILHHSGNDILQRALPNCSARRLENIGHIPMVEIPKRMAKLILKECN